MSKQLDWDTIRQRLREIRLQQHLTQEELGRQVGLSKGTISNYENGQREPDLHVIHALAQALQVTDEDILEGSAQPSASHSALKETERVYQPPSQEFAVWDRLLRALETQNAVNQAQAATNLAQAEAFKAQAEAFRAQLAAMPPAPRFEEKSKGES